MAPAIMIERACSVLAPQGGSVLPLAITEPDPRSKTGAGRDDVAHPVPG